MAQAIQYDLIDSDPRHEIAEPGVLEQLATWRKCCKEHGGLMSQVQAATLAGVAVDTIYGKVRRGHFTVYELFGLKCLPVDEIVMYLKERDSEEKAKGGRGLKKPRYFDLLRAE